MKVLFAINEATPLYKIGGLGDVGGSLPKSLAYQNIDIRLCLPRHPEIKLDHSWHEHDRFTIKYDHEILPISVFHGFLPQTNIPTYLFHEKKYISKHTDASDNHADKYTVFCLSVSKWISSSNSYWSPQIIHLNDWHTALIPLLLKHKYANTQFKYFLTIHNLLYQGTTTTPIAKKAELDPQSCRILSWDQMDHDLNILMEGIIHSHITSTVSPTYSKEILTRQYGQHLENILRIRKSRLIGIINGLDTQTFDPATDKHLPHKYSIKNALAKKQLNKQFLLKSLNLPTQNDKLLISFIGRVDPKQKGIDLIINAINNKQLPIDNSLFVFLGTGDSIYEALLHQAAGDNPNIKVITRFDEPLSRQIYAASDLLLIPSLFEPCGLIQLIAMRYGTIPVARSTGGLKDTIINEQTGFIFKDYSTKSMIQSLHQASRSISDKTRQIKLISAAMKTNFSWHKSAKLYIDQYQNLLTKF